MLTLYNLAVVHYLHLSYSFLTRIFMEPAFLSSRTGGGPLKTEEANAHDIVEIVFIGREVHLAFNLREKVRSNAETAAALAKNALPLGKAMEAPGRSEPSSDEMARAVPSIVPRNPKGICDYLKMPVEQFLASAKTPPEKRKDLNRALIDLLNKNWISFDSLGTDTMEQVLHFFGEDTQEIRTIIFGLYFRPADTTFLDNFPKLNSLILQGCCLIRDFSFLSHIPSTVTELNLSHCYLKDLDFLERCPQLLSLDMSLNSSVPKKCYASLKHCQRLKTLNLQGCFFIDSIADLSFLGHLPQLEKLNLSGMWWRNLDFLKLCPTVEDLNVANNDFLETTEARNPFQGLSHLRRLTHLSLGKHVKSFEFLKTYAPHLAHLTLDVFHTLDPKAEQLLAALKIKVKNGFI